MAVGVNHSSKAIRAPILHACLLLCVFLLSAGQVTLVRAGQSDEVGAASTEIPQDAAQLQIALMSGGTSPNISPEWPASTDSTVVFASREQADSDADFGFGYEEPATAADAEIRKLPPEERKDVVRQPQQKPLGELPAVEIPLGGDPISYRSCSRTPIGWGQQSTNPAGSRTGLRSASAVATGRGAMAAFSQCSSWLQPP